MGSRAIYHHMKSISAIRKSCIHSKSVVLDCPMENIKNIGILAHIDAGKTTTSERMLYFSGIVDHIGEVDKGDTVMDYMEQERARGITIVSAAITFPWLNHRINLIDTPGHVDFTIEVERALCVLDGAVCILDASAGVEAQTLTVWSQAERYQVPSIFYLNKMDKPGASVKMCLDSIENKLRANPLLVQIPVFVNNQITGCVDLVSKEVWTWQKNVDSSGRRYEITPLNERIHGELFDSASQKRNDLIERLCDIDDKFATSAIEKSSLDDVTSAELDVTLKRATLSRTGLPVLCGSSYKNVGVQPLLNAVTKYLPNPIERGRDYRKLFSDHMCAMAFKIVHDKQKGPLTYFRVYSGELKQNQRVYNATRNSTAKLVKVMVPFADEYVEVDHVANGNIAIVSGLKGVVTGDILTSSQSIYHSSQKELLKAADGTSDQSDFLKGPRVPEPVFFSSVEAASLSEQKNLDQALECMKLEDPTLKVKYDPETGQTVLGGMGELHLEIIKDRLAKEYKCHVELGPMQVAYKEYIHDSSRTRFEYKKVIGSTKVRVTIEMSVSPLDDLGEKTEISLVKEKDNLDNLVRITPATMAAIKDGVELALSMGPRSGSPVSGVKVGIHSYEAPSRTSEVAISAAASQCISQLLQEVGTGFLEPVMTVELVLEDQFSQGVVGDLSKRRATELEFGQRLGRKVIRTEVPLGELRGYSTVIRTLTSGTASFSMELSAYRVVPEDRVSKLMKEITGITYS